MGSRYDVKLHSTEATFHLSEARRWVTNNYEIGPISQLWRTIKQQLLNLLKNNFQFRNQHYDLR